MKILYITFVGPDIYLKKNKTQVTSSEILQKKSSNPFNSTISDLKLALFFYFCSSNLELSFYSLFPSFYKELSPDFRANSEIFYYFYSSDLGMTLYSLVSSFF